MDQLQHIPADILYLQRSTKDPPGVCDRHRQLTLKPVLLQHCCYRYSFQLQETDLISHAAITPSNSGVHVTLKKKKCLVCLLLKLFQIPQTYSLLEDCVCLGFFHPKVTTFAISTWAKQILSYAFTVRLAFSSKNPPC